MGELNTQPQPQNKNEIRIYPDGSCPENSKVNEKNCAAGWRNGNLQVSRFRFEQQQQEPFLQQARSRRTIRFEHIKGHSNDTGNDAADELANKGAKGKACRTTEEWNIIKHSHPEKPEESERFFRPQTMVSTAPRG